MARSASPLLALASGHIGKQLVIKQYQGKTVITKFPEFSKKRKFTILQVQAQEKMSNANYEAKKILDDPALSMAAQARLNVTKNKLYTALVKEYFIAHRNG